MHLARPSAASVGRIARRRAEPGWRAAVLNERAERVRKAAAYERQPQRAERAIYKEGAEALFPSRATSTNCASVASTGPSGEVCDEVGGFHERLREQPAYGTWRARLSLRV
jgi:transposase InsO family protein